MKVMEYVIIYTTKKDSMDHFYIVDTFFEVIEMVNQFRAKGYSISKIWADGESMYI